jgi:hypothetical protein
LACVLFMQGGPRPLPCAGKKSVVISGRSFWASYHTLSFRARRALAENSARISCGDPARAGQAHSCGRGELAKAFVVLPGERVDRAARGLPSLPGFVSTGGGCEISGAICHSKDDNAQPEYVGWQSSPFLLSSFLAPWPCGLVFNTALANTVFNTTIAVTIFSAILHDRIGSTPAEDSPESFSDTFVEIRRPTAVHRALKFTTDSDEGAVRQVVGLILAMCLANSAGYPARQSPLRVDLRLKGWPGSAGSARRGRS